MKKLFALTLIGGCMLLLTGLVSCAAPSDDPTDDVPTSTPTAIPQADENDIFVDAARGEDSAAGTLSAPVKTLAKAQELARAKLKTADAGSTVTVYLRAGTYELDKTLTFTSEDSAEGKNTVYTAYNGEKAVISGGKNVTGWTLADAGKNIWSAPAPAVESRDFFVNGVRASRASTTDFKCIRFDSETVSFASSLGTLARPQDLEIVLQNYWNLPRIGAQSMEDEGDAIRVTMKQPGWNVYYETSSLGGAKLNTKQFVRLENAYEFLDTPGEWYLNTDTETIYYIPREGEDLSTSETVLGNLEQLILLKGTNSSPVCDITFEGVEFRYTTWLQASSDEGLLTIQANFYKKGDMTASTQFDNSKWLTPSSAVYGTMDRNITFRDNLFTCLGNGGIHLEAGTKNAAITGNRFTDCAGTAIAIGGFHDADHNAVNASGSDWDKKSCLLTENNAITDNYIQNCASVYAGGVGIAAGYVRYTDISYNTILDMPYTAISLGWGWGCNGKELVSGTYYTDEEGMFLFRNNSITHNYIENIMNVLFDGGGIYTLGRNDNSTISDNYIHLVNNDYGAIYLDNGSSGFTVTNNVVSNAFRNYIYKGDYNNISDNYTTADTAKRDDLPMLEPLKEGETHYTFKNNYQWDEDAVAAIRDAAGVRKK